MKRLIYLLTATLALVAAVTSCDDTSTTIGSSLMEDKVEIIIDSTFTLSGRSVAHNRVQSRTTTQLLGRIQADGFGALSSDVVTQFMPGLLMQEDKFRMEDIDSVKLILQMTNGAFTGDSILPMGIKVYPLTRQLPSPIYSDFDPKDYYDPSNLWGSAVYTANALGRPDSIQSLNTRNIEVTLPLEFAKNVYNQYKTSPETFSTPALFSAWFPGLYIANSFGNGRVTRIDKSYITMFYHIHDKSDKTGNDTIYYYANTYLAVTPEVVSNNNIDYAVAPALKARADAGEPLIVAPLGYDVEVTFPAQEIVDYYRQNAGKIAVLNALSMEIPAEEISNDYGICPPPYILMVQSDKMTEFFAKNLIADNKTSFYAVYDRNKKVYRFSDMREYINMLLARESIKPGDCTFTLTPVTVNSETSSMGYTTTEVVTGIVPYISTPVMGRLLLDKAKIKLTFSKQTVVF